MPVDTIPILELGGERFARIPHNSGRKDSIPALRHCFCDLFPRLWDACWWSWLVGDRWFGEENKSAGDETERGWAGIDVLSLRGVRSSRQGSRFESLAGADLPSTHTPKSCISRLHSMASHWGDRSGAVQMRLVRPCVRNHSKRNQVDEHRY